MIDRNKIIALTNRDTGTVEYTLPDTGTRRVFSAGETKMVTFDEIEKLSWARGGRALLKNYLIIGDNEVAQEILGEIEPEYYYDQETIKELLLNGSLDQLKDALDFAPAGVVDLIKQEAVDLKINSIDKREAIKKQTHFDVDTAIRLNQEEEETNSSVAATTKRRTSPLAANTQKTDSSGAQGKYKIINK